ncbi:MAG: restriction endonuclease subunit S [Acidobacteriota bacterium]
MAAKDHLTSSGQGSTVKTIYMPALEDFRIALPTLNEQHEIVRRVETLFAYADRLEAPLPTGARRSGTPDARAAGQSLSRRTGAARPQR